MGAGASVPTFAEIETDADGTLSPAVITSAFRKWGVECPVERATFLVDKFATGGRGWLTKEDSEKMFAYLKELLTSPFADEINFAWGLVPDKKSPNDKVRELIREFEANEQQVSLSVAVAEVEAMQQASTKMIRTIEACNKQIKEVDERLRGASRNLAKNVVDHMTAAKATLDARVQSERAALDVLSDRYRNVHLKTTSRYTPQLITTVDLYEDAFARFKETEVDALARVADLCETLKGRKAPLQQLPCGASDPCHVSTLILLSKLADNASQPLGDLAGRACKEAGGGRVVLAPIKGVQRAIQKVQEDYGGDYTRLIDLMRCTLVFETVSTLVCALDWMFGPQAKSSMPGFEACRAKDRLSLKWDAELSGGNRDVLINGWLKLPDESQFVVEIQFHLAPLLALKGSLHTLYDGVRVLGASDDLVVLHEGELSESTMKSVELGVVRKVSCGRTPLTPEIANRLEKVLQYNPGTLIELRLPYATINGKEAFLGWELSRLLRVPPGHGKLPCWRLRVLELGFTGLTGAIPEAICDCVNLEILKMQYNDLLGPIPTNIGNCTKLRLFVLLKNPRLSGPIPDSIGKCILLEDFDFRVCALSGPIPESIGNCTMLTFLGLDSGNSLSGTVPESLAKLTSLEQVRLGGNKELTISEALKAKLLSTTKNHKDNTWPNEV